MKYCITCASGTDALLIPLMANNIGLEDAVFTTNFSFFSTTEVISHLGATPIFVDIQSNTYNINPDLLEIKIKEVINHKKLKPRAIIAVDLFGQLADYDKIEKIAKKYNLLLIEDAAQSFGASYKDKKSCSFGNVAATSFYPAKPFGCYGDGGAIFTNSLEQANLYKSIRVHGQDTDKYDNIRIGLNSRLDTIQAAVLLRKLNIFNHELKQRNDIADYYNESLKECVQIPEIKNNYISSWAQYSIALSDNTNREELIQLLEEQEIPTAIFYKNPFNALGMYRRNSSDNYPVSDKISNSILSLPMHPYLSIEELDKITSVIKGYYND